MMPVRNWKVWLVRGTLLLWGLNVLWIGWHFGPEAGDLARRLARGEWGATIRQEDPFYRWLASLAPLIPEGATYIFLDNYEAGKEIEARYFLAPRRHLLLPPEVDPSFLFYALHQNQASFLIIRDRTLPLGPGAAAALRSTAVHELPLPGPGRVFRVDPAPLGWGFYD